MIIHDVEQGKEAWHKVRSGRPTSSMFSSLVTGLGKPSDGLKEYAHTLATEKMIGGAIDDGFFGNKYTKRGQEMEAISRADYEMTRQTPVTEVGFITDDLMRYGSSTDGLVGDDGVVEFKNLIATSFMKLLIYTKRNKGKTPPSYIPQLQGELMIAEREWVDIVFYHPQFEPIIHRHYPDEKFQQVLKEQLMSCIAERNNILKIAQGE